MNKKQTVVQATLNFLEQDVNSTTESSTSAACEQQPDAACEQPVFAVTQGNIGTAVPRTGAEIAQALADPQLAKTVAEVRAETDEQKQKELKEQKKYEIIGVCPHFSCFRNNHRAAAEAIAESCTYQTSVDVDDRQFGQQAIDGALRLNATPGKWHDKVTYIENSLRAGGKCHIWLIQPVGMTAIETQEAFCKEVGIPCDDSVQQKQSFILMTGDAVYQSPRWLKPLSHDEIEARRTAFTLRGLSIDGWEKATAAKAPQTDTLTLHDASSPAVTPAPPTERTRFIFKECLKESGLSVNDLNEEGGRYNAFKSILSVGATQLLTEAEFLGVAQELSPDYSQEKEFVRLVSDFYSKYHDEAQRMTQFQRRVFASSRKIASSLPSSNQELKEPSDVAVYGDTASLSLIYGSPVPPRLSKQATPRFVKTATGPVPSEAKETAAQTMFPPLGMYCDAQFEYIDNTPREPRANCCIIANTGGGKDSSTKHMLSHLEAPQKAKDGPNRKILEDHKAKCRAMKDSVDKPPRPAVSILSVAPDITKARLSELMADSMGRIVHTRMVELDQWFAVEGYKPGPNCPFTYLKMTDDEGNPFGQERVGKESITYQGPLSINWNASTTPGKAQYYFRNNMTDGPISRLTLATVPDQGLGAPMPKHGKYDDKYDAALKPYIDNLSQVHGLIVCRQAKRLAERLKQEIDDFVVQSGDEVLNNLSRRALVAAFRKACVLYAANGLKWEKAIEGFCRWSMHYDLWLKLHFFGDLIRSADKDVHTSHRGPQNMLHLLSDPFTLQQLKSLRTQCGMSEEGARNQISQWVKRGHCEELPDGSFRHLSKPE